eukprot:350204-Pyramimonas_sp.AAC.1
MHEGLCHGAPPTCAGRGGHPEGSILFRVCPPRLPPPPPSNVKVLVPSRPAHFGSAAVGQSQTSSDCRGHWHPARQDV